MRRWTTAAWVIAGCTAAGIALSQPTQGPPAAKSGEYPARPIRLLIPFPPAGTADTLARGLGQKLSEYYGQSLIMDNRPGAGGNLATELAAKSKPDGYTLVIATPGTVRGERDPAGQGNLQFDPAQDFEPLSLLARSPLILITHPSIPVRNIAELLRLAKIAPR